MNTDLNEYREPNTYNEAIRNSDKMLWKKAMDSEMNSLKENKTWVLVDLPKNRKAIPCKWVFRIKLNSDGSVEKYKARLVIKGFSQKKGIDYDQTFSPVAKSGTIRAVLSVAASEGLSLLQFDVTTAFLNSSIDEEIFMKQPEGYNDGSGRVCLLRRSLYGLKQAPRCWNRCIADVLKEIGFRQSDADACLFIKERRDSKLMLVLNEFIDELKLKFKINTKPTT